MPFKDPEKERAYRRKYRAAHPEQRKAITARYKAKHYEEILAYSREYNKRPEVIEKRKEYYLEHREQMLLDAKRNRLMKRYKNPKLTVTKRRKSSRESARRKRLGIVFQRTEEGYFWKSGKIFNGPFNYKKEAIKDAMRAFV